MTSGSGSGVLDVVRTFLEKSPDWSAVDLLAGELVERERIMRSVPRHTRTVGCRAEIGTLQLVDETEAKAVCDVDAVLVVELVEMTGGPTLTHWTRISGPMRLTREEGHWKITDYLRDGIPVHDTYRLYHGAPALTAGSLAVAPLLTLLLSGGISVTFDVDNRGRSSVSLRDGYLERRFPGGRTRGLVGAATVASGSRGLVDVGWALRGSPPPLLRIRLDFETPQGDAESVRFSLPFRGDDAEA